MTYVTLSEADKLKLLREHCFDGAKWPSLDDEKWCLHCGQKFNGHAARVWQDAGGSLWLECGTRDCDGSPIDWADYPWWDKHHPLTKKLGKDDPFLFVEDEEEEEEDPAGGDGHPKDRPNG